MLRRNEFVKSPVTRLFCLQLLLLAGITPVLRGDSSLSSTATVVAAVQPVISIGSDTVKVVGGVMAMDGCVATVRFHVLANTGVLYLSVEATGLYRNGDPGLEVPPIGLDLVGGVEITPTDAHPRDGASNIARFTGESTIESLPARKTEAICFESNQTGCFDQDVFVTVTWNRDNPNIPAGQYLGKVRLTAVVMP